MNSIQNHCIRHLMLMVVSLGGVQAGASPMPLMPVPEENLTFSIEARTRGEWRENNFDFDSGNRALTDDSWLLTRLRLGMDWKPESWLRVHLEGQDAREFFSDRPNVIGQLGAEGDDAMDLRQGYLELGDPKHLALSLGRMELDYGDGRLVSRAPWKNVGQSFDAVKMRVAGDDWWLDAFASSVVKFKSGGFNQSSWLEGGEQTFSGLYFHTTALKFQATELYAFELHDHRSDFLTLGTRWKGDSKQLAGWDYDLEMAAQAGTVGDRDLSAFAGHWGVGYQWQDLAWKPRLGLEYAFASGDPNPNDGRVKTFQNLFPTNHPFYGLMDEFSWRNISNPAVRFSMKPAQSLTVSLDYHCFWLADTKDAWYRSNQTTMVRPVTPGADSHAGSEIDFVLAWKATQHLELQGGYSHFFAGQYLADTGADADADFAFLSLTAAF